jgi:hypothetical protein
MKNMVPTYHASVNTEYEELNFLAYKLTAIEIARNIVQWRPLIIIADNVINRLLLSKSVVPKHSI